MDDEANCPVDQDGDDGNQEMGEEEEEVEDESQIEGVDFFCFFLLSCVFYVN